nr:putative ribonuclease H-like domain-containing protein [Tanacetum cinerariifolium]
MNYQPVTAGNQSNPSVGFQDKFDAENAAEESDQQYVLFLVWSSGSINPQNTDGDAAFDEKESEFDEKKHESEVNVSPRSSAQSKKHDDKTKKEAKGKSLVESLTGYRNLSAEFEDYSDNNINEDNAAGILVPAIGQISPNSTNSFSDAELEDITYSDDEDDVGVEADINNLETSITEELLQFKMHKVWVLVDLPHGKRAIGTKWVFKNKKDERGIVVRNKARLVAQGHIQDKGIDYEEVFAPVARIEAIRLFLAYASFMGFMVYQMDVKSAFLYGTIEEDVYVYQPLGFEDPDYPDKVYKVVKALYGLHQAPRAWKETLENYLLEKGFQRGKIDQTLFIKRQKGDILLVQIYVDDIIFGSTNKDLCKSFEKLMKDKFQMSSMGELTFFLGLQVKQKKDGIFISQDKYVAEILRKFGLIDGKSDSTPIDTEKPLLKDPDGCSKWHGVFEKEGACFTYLKCWFIHLITNSSQFTMSNPHQELASPDQTVSGKDSSNPLMADNLPKIIWKQIGDLSTHTTKYTSPALTHKVFANMRRVGKGFSGVKTPLFEGMIVEQQVAKGDDVVHDEGVPAAGVVTEKDDAGISMNLLQEVMDTCTALIRRVEHLELDKIAQALEITMLKRRVKKLERRNTVKVLKLKRLQKVRTAHRINTSDDTVMNDVSNQGRLIANIDADADVVLEEAKDVAADAKDNQDANVQVNADIQGRTVESQIEIYKNDLDHANKVLSMHEEESEPAELQEVVDIVTTTKIITEVVTAASTTIIAAANVLIPATTTVFAPKLTAAPSRRTKGVVIMDLKESTTTTSKIIHSEAKSKDKGKGILVEESKPLKKQAQIEQDEKYTRELKAELNRTIDWDGVIDHVNKKAKEDKYVKRYQAMKRKPQTEAQARKNMMLYLKNVAGFKMDYFKGMTYDDIRPIFKKYFNFNVNFLLKSKEQIDEEESRALKRINKTPAEKAAKRQKLDEEVEELKRHLQIVPNKDDDVYTEATLLARKVPVVDYENNKPYFKIIRADGTHQLYVSFLSLLRNFDREDLEALWSLVNERFATAKPKNFSDIFC